MKRDSARRRGPGAGDAGHISQELSGEGWVLFDGERRVLERTSFEERLGRPGESRLEESIEALGCEACAVVDLEESLCVLRELPLNLPGPAIVLRRDIDPVSGDHELERGIHQGRSMAEDGMECELRQQPSRDGRVARGKHERTAREGDVVDRVGRGERVVVNDEHSEAPLCEHGAGQQPAQMAAHHDHFVVALHSVNGGLGTMREGGAFGGSACHCGRGPKVSAPWAMARTTKGKSTYSTC
jgi:hypothetical protein